VLSGRLAEGLSLMNEALESDEQWQALIVAHMGEACLLADRLDDAVAFADRALTFARERGQRGYEAWALRLQGEIASHHDRPDVATAEAHYRAARALASELGMRPLVAHCHFGLGRLYRRIGDGIKAQEHLTTATTMFREMDMGFWREKAEAELEPLHRNSR
jgi:tetratricopeptide (TPR) repeat protein